MIDARFQGRGYGTAALRLILSELERERKYPCAEVCVKKDDRAALRVYEKVGFAGLNMPSFLGGNDEIKELDKQVKDRKAKLDALEEQLIEDDEFSVEVHGLDIIICHTTHVATAVE